MCAGRASSPSERHSTPRLSSSPSPHTHGTSSFRSPSSASRLQGAGCIGEEKGDGGERDRVFSWHPSGHEVTSTPCGGWERKVGGWLAIIPTMAPQTHTTNTHRQQLARALRCRHHNRYFLVTAPPSASQHPASNKGRPDPRTASPTPTNPHSASRWSPCLAWAANLWYIAATVTECSTQGGDGRWGQGKGIHAFHSIRPTIEFLAVERPPGR